MTFKTIALWFGIIWLFVASLIWLAGMGMIAYNKGLGEFLAVMSPFNIMQWIVTALFFAPGFVGLHLGSKP